LPTLLEENSWLRSRIAKKKLKGARAEEKAQQIKEEFLALKVKGPENVLGG